MPNSMKQFETKIVFNKTPVENTDLNVNPAIKWSFKTSFVCPLHIFISKACFITSFTTQKVNIFFVQSVPW